MAKLLIVDDEKIISHSLQRVLARAGHDIQVANNGIDAIHIISQDSKFDLIFLDLLMPEIGGAEVLRFIKQKNASTKVLMMTAYGDNNAKEELIKAGATMVLSKPFDDIMQIPALVESTLAQ